MESRKGLWSQQVLLIELEKKKHQLVLKESSSSHMAFQFTSDKSDAYPNGKNLRGLKTQLYLSCEIRLPSASKEKKHRSSKI